MMQRIVSGLWVFTIYCSMFVPFVERSAAQTVTSSRINRMKDVPSGLKFRLSEGAGGADARVKQPLAAADDLPNGATADLLKRLPAITQEASDQTDFAKRLGTLPAPKNGKLVPVKFPSDAQRGTPKVNPGTSLDVVRFSPEGEVSLAPDLSVTFSQPMVAVTSQGEAAKYAPAEITPRVEGRWRWLGTRTLMFDTDKRFPMATRFTVRVPAGTRSANGQTLEKDVAWNFTTPPPKVEQMIPQNQVTTRDAIIFISFDQAIDPAAVLKTISVSSGGRNVAIRLATQEEIDRDGSISYYAKQAQPGRWLAFRAVNADGSTENGLPAASTISVSVNAGTPSAEGPLRTQKAQVFSFTTFGPFKFKKAYCGWEQNKNCSPFHDWYIEFNNPIDASKFTKEMVKVEPPVEGLKVHPQGNQIYISGYKKGRTNYRITIDGALADTFGQTLGQPAVATIRVGSADENLYSQGGPMVVLDPFGSRSYSIYSTNFSSARVRLYAVEPKVWNQYQQYYRRLNYDDGKRPAIPGTLVSEKVVQIVSRPDELVETRIDVSPALKDGFGSVIVDVEPIENVAKAVTVRGRSWRVLSWLQATQIGLDAFVDNRELVAFVTELRTGKPMAGVDLAISPNPAVASGQLSVISEEKGWIEWAWTLVSGASGPNAEDIRSFDADGTEIESEPVAGAQTNRTGPDGVLRLGLPDSQSGPNILIARRGKDVAFLPENSDYYWQDTGNWYRKPDHDSLRWFVFDDRKMYRPKEEVAVKGYIRRVTGGKLGDVEGLAEAASGLTWSVKDARDNEIASGKGTLNTFGAFDFKFTLPDNANLGYSRIDLSTNSSLSGNTFSHQFQIEEFRRPEFEVTTKVESEAPHFVGGKADLSVEAKYYSGGGLANAETNWTVTATPTNYTPPNRGDYTFGTWLPWWRSYDHGDGGRGGYFGGGITQTFKGVTDAGGKHLLKIDFESVSPPRPYNVSASASVQDVNRQTWSSTSTLLVHPADLYVGIKTERTFVQKGERIIVESIVTDIDGKLIAGREVEIKAILKDWQFDKGTWSEVTIDEQTCSVKSPQGSHPDGVVGAKCEFVAKQGGRYTITATVMDDRERLNESELTVWVPGGKQPPKRNVEQEEVQVIPSKKDHAPGDVAELLVISPFTPAEGILTLRRDGIVKVERFSMKDSSVTLKVPLDEKYLPNIYAQVDLVGATPRQNDKGEVDPKLSQRPAFASGNINIPISTASRKLTVTAEPKDKTLAPGGDTKVAVEVKDSNGVPVANSEVAVVVVDESVLALSAYRIADPLSIFYTDRAAGVTDHHLRKDVLLGNPDDVKNNPPPPPAGDGAVNMSAAETGSDSSARQMENLPRAVRSELKDSYKKWLSTDVGYVLTKEDSPIALRQNFNALAVFAPSSKTDANGRVLVDVKLPDNLTRYRITAVAVDTGKRFGSSESTITAKQPLMVRPSAPRFMNFGDRIDLPVVVQNQTDQDLAVDVAVRATNALLSEPGAVATGFLTNGPPEGGAQNAAGKRVLVKANSREEVRFRVAAVKAGTARFQIAVTSGKFTDAAEISLPVWTPATTEAFATYGTTDENGAIIQPVQTPGDVFPQFGGLEITTSSTQLQELTDAFIYLTNYPYGCSEQIASRMISIAAMRDVLAAFKSKDMPTAKELEAQFARDLEILQSRQRDDGSFGLWKRDRERYEFPFLTVHVAHALILAKAKGYKVPDEMLNKTKPYLKDVEKHFNDEWYKKAPKVRWTISAYALYVRDLMGDKDSMKAKRLLAEAAKSVPMGGDPTVSQTGRRFEAMPFEALGWILSVLANDPNSVNEVSDILRFLMNRTTETAATANFVTDYGDGGWLVMHSNRRADGVLLEALIKADKHNIIKSPGVQAVINEPLAGTPAPPSFADLIPKLVRGLLAHRTKGHWGSTQENVFILLALDKYFHAFEKVTPNFVTRIWLGNTYAGEEKFAGRSVDSNLLNIPMSYLIEQGGVANLLIDRQGAGRLYYRIGMKYAPKNLKLDPADYGFTVLRKYEAVDNADDVKQNADGSWSIASGARVRVRLTMVAQARRYHVALVDSLPAGLEILNPGLAVTEVVPRDTGGDTGVITHGSRSFGHGSYYWSQYWFEHQNFRDERAEAFSSLLWEGVYNYTYVARATTPGEFIVPPAKAEEMYHPETFGRTGTDFVRVR